MNSYTRVWAVIISVHETWSGAGERGRAGFMHDPFPSWSATAFLSVNAILSYILGRYQLDQM